MIKSSWFYVKFKYAEKVSGTFSPAAFPKGLLRGRLQPPSLEGQLWPPAERTRLRSFAGEFVFPWLDREHCAESQCSAGYGLGM